MEPVKRIALVAHDSTKPELIDWVRTHRDALRGHKLWATGTTGGLLRKECPELQVTLLLSGPLGGDQQIGAMIAEGKLDVLIFFIDPMSPHPHEPDVRALTRLSTLYNVAVAANRATADFIISSRLFHEQYGGRDGPFTRPG